MTPRTLYTIGHAKRETQELIDILLGVGVTRLIDIRRFPASRTNPQFNGDTLEAELARAGIAYRHMLVLGGRRSRKDSAVDSTVGSTVDSSIDSSVNAGWRVRAFHDYADYALGAAFQAGLRELLALSARETCAIMCAETLWWRCHRRIVTDHVLARGVPVVHLFTKTHREPASLTPFAVVGPRGRVSYPAVPCMLERCRFASSA